MHTQQASHTSHMNLQACAIHTTQQQENWTHFHTHFIDGSQWNILINFDAYLTIVSPHTIHPM